ncbi:MAG: histidine--tRNA ligase [Candidatus Cloacimonetes bacterium]|nr:histidine--tRNA ligase [Candidatus Cloacimonadota bacterium]
MQAVKGMRDFYPQDYRIREWLFQIFREASLKSGFEFYDASVVEHEELYVRKAGEEITEQLYTFEDKSGRKIALRPEMTPTLARMVIAQYRQLPGRLKWAAIAQCFRYERMTRGRKREHYQWNLDVLGDESQFAELELLTTAIHALESMGLSSNEVKLRISNRNLLADVLTGLGVDKSDHIKVFLQIDKLGKMEDSALIEALVKEGIPQTLALRVLEVVQLKSLDEVSALVIELNAPKQGLNQIKELFSLLNHYGFSDWLVFDFSIVRGLAYYTGTVFEFFDASRGLRAIAGGGRYDHLIQNLADIDLSDKAKGSISMPAVGFGFGDVVILELLSDLKKLPEIKPHLDFYLAPFGEEERILLLPLLKELRHKGFFAEMHAGIAKPRKLLEAALEKGALHCIMMGSEEKQKGEIRIKTFATREEQSLNLSDFLSSL